MIYKYDGPVKRFEEIVIPRFISYTSAPSKAKAVSNFSYKAKRRLKLSNFSKVYLDPKYVTEAKTFSGTNN